MQSSLKLIFILFATPIMEWGFLPPNPTPSAKELVEPSKVVTIIWLGNKIHRFSLWSWALTEFVVTFSASGMCPVAFTRHITRLLVHSPEPQQAVARVSSLSPGFCIGVCLVLAGSLIRVHCYRVLGRFFTFELSIREKHRLITTGPYAIIRHPSYTGVIVYLIGIVICFLHRDSWLVACSGWLPHDEHLSNQVLWGLRVCLPLSSFLMRFRINDEDAMLKKNFGKEWEDWASRVPYKVIPWVY